MLPILTALSAMAHAQTPAHNPPAQIDTSDTAEYGSLIVHTTPVNAKVDIDGESRGRTPLQLMLPAGRYQMQLQLLGFVTTTRAIEIVANEETTINTVLEPAPKFTPATHAIVWGSLGLGGALAGVGHIGAHQSANAMRDGDIGAEGSNRAFSITAIVGWSLMTAGAIIGVVAWLSPPREEQDEEMTCQLFQVTGSRMTKRVCVPKKKRGQ